MKWIRGSAAMMRPSPVQTLFIACRRVTRHEDQSPKPSTVRSQQSQSAASVWPPSSQAGACSSTTRVALGVDVNVILAPLCVCCIGHYK
jgi:hypothetical protein